MSCKLQETTVGAKSPRWSGLLVFCFFFNASEENGWRFSNLLSHACFTPCARPDFAFAFGQYPSSRTLLFQCTFSAVHSVCAHFVALKGDTWRVAAFEKKK
eukprot:RCo031953